ncbi:MAG: hypothetical protein ACREQ5_29985, partial [Candidatus Dormibacteria bacterium]
GAQAAQALQAQAAQAGIQKTQAEAAMNSARARNYLTQADILPDHADAQTADTASQIADRSQRTQLEAMKVASAA